MGSLWKMPNKDQYQDLINNTTSEWITFNGVNGRKLTSKTDSTKYIFFPAGGSWTDMDYNYAGKNGNYWSTLWGKTQSQYVYFNIDTRFFLTTIYRYVGQSVRAIQ